MCSVCKSILICFVKLGTLDIVHFENCGFSKESKYVLHQRPLLHIRSIRAKTILIRQLHYYYVKGEKSNCQKLEKYIFSGARICNVKLGWNYL